MGMTFYDYNHCTPFLPGILRDTFIAKVTESIGNAYFRLGPILVAFLERLEINVLSDSFIGKVTESVGNTYFRVGLILGYCGFHAVNGDRFCKRQLVDHLSSVEQIARCLS